MPLQTLFTPMNPRISSIRQYQQGDTFHLTADVGLVMEGVVAVDALALAANARPVTIRLAGSGDMLNLESVLGDVTAKCQYYCESKVVVCMTRAGYLKKCIDEAEPDQQSALLKELLEAMRSQSAELLDAATWFGSSPAEPRLEWALKRLYALTKRPDLPLSKARAAVHIGANVMTVTRALRSLQERGVVAQITRNFVKLRGFL